MRKQSLNFVSFVAANLVGIGLPAGSCDVACVLMLFSTDRSADCVGQHFSLEGHPWQSNLKARYFCVPRMFLPRLGSE